MKKKLLWLMSILIMISITFGYVPVEASVVKKITNQELEEIITDIICWAKQGNDVLLNPLFLESAGETGGDWFPIGIGRYGYSKESYEPYLKKINEVVTARYKEDGKLHAVKATEWHRISLAVLAMGGDPTKIGTDSKGNPINLIADGSYNFVGRKSVDGQGINGAIWALISVDSLNYKIPEDARYQRDDLITLITKRQLADGGFALGGTKADPDITGMALQAFAPYYNSTTTYPAYNGEQKTIKQIVEESLKQLSLLQQKDGDYYSWGTVNVESTVQVLTALCSLGIDPYEDSRFIKNGKTLIDGILKYRCKDGGFAHSFVNDTANPSAVAAESNRMATEQTLYGLVSYYRLANNMRRLYDFRPEIQTDRFVWKDEENNIWYVSPYQKEQKEYTVKLMPKTKELVLVNLPFLPYEECNLEIGDVISVAEQKSLFIESKLDTYQLNYELAETAQVNSVETLIKLLPKPAKLSVENLEETKREVTLIQNILEENGGLQKEITLSLNKLFREVASQIEKLELNQEIDENIEDHGSKSEVKDDDAKQEVENKEENKNENKVESTGGSSSNQKVSSSEEEENKKVQQNKEQTTESALEEKSEIVSENMKFEDLIPKDMFKTVQGKDLIIEGITSGNGENRLDCSIKFYGKDIVSPMDFTVGVTCESKYKEDIEALSPEAFVIRLLHQGTLPGEALLECQTGLESGEYLLFSYDTTDKRAIYESKMNVEEGKARFVIQKNVEYFIAKGSNMNSLIEKDSTSDKTEDITVGEPEQSQNLEALQEEISNLNQSLLSMAKVNQMDTYVIAGSIVIGCIFIGVCIIIQMKLGKNAYEK